MLCSAPAAIALQMLAVLREEAPELIVWETKTMADHLPIVRFPARVSAAVFGVFALLAVSLAAIGGVLGLLAAFAASRLLSGLLYGVEASDPVTFVGVVALLGAIAFLASWIPAPRASQINPVQALRSE